MSFTYKSPLQDSPYDDKCQESYKPTSQRPESRLPSKNRQRPASSPYERPGSSSQASYSDRYRMDSYPKELNQMFGAMECKLCSVEMSSPITAKMHYSGKPHTKKVKNYLMAWSLKNNQPMPMLQQQTALSSECSLPDYCELCDASLISTHDKILHYAGKNHKKNERDPVNAKRKIKTYDTIDLSATDARFGIGASFTPGTNAAVAAEDIKPSSFVCELCDVKAVSEDQLNVHLNGKKHQEKLRKKESNEPKPDESSRPYKCDICNISLETEWKLRMHLDGKPHAKALIKLGIAGQSGSTFKCAVCKCYFTSYHAFQSHMKGEKHEKNLRQNPLMIGNSIRVEKEDSDQKKWECIYCSAVFESLGNYDEHTKSKRHLLTTLTVEADKISRDKIHYYCFTCRKQYNDQKEYVTHQFEYRHMTLWDKNYDISFNPELWYCKVCATMINQAGKDEHFRSKGHLLLAAQKDITDSLMALATEDLGTNNFVCSHCKIEFQNFITFSEHMLDAKHLEKIVSQKLEEGF